VNGGPSSEKRKLCMLRPAYRVYEEGDGAGETGTAGCASVYQAVDRGAVRAF